MLTHFGPRRTVKPLLSESTKNAVTSLRVCPLWCSCEPVTANRIMKSASPAWLMKCFEPFNKKLNKNIEVLNKFSDWIKEKIKSSKDDANAASNEYLKVLGLVATAHAWIKVLEVSYKDYENNKKFYEEKIQTANFFFNRVLPRVESYYLTATSGSNYIMDFKFK